MLIKNLTAKTLMVAALLLATLSGCGRGTYDPKVQSAIQRAKNPPADAPADQAQGDAVADQAPADGAAAPMGDAPMADAPMENPGATN